MNAKGKKMKPTFEKKNLIETVKQNERGPALRAGRKGWECHSVAVATKKKRSEQKRDLGVKKDQTKEEEKGCA